MLSYCIRPTIRATSTVAWIQERDTVCTVKLPNIILSSRFVSFGSPSIPSFLFFPLRFPPFIQYILSFLFIRKPPTYLPSLYSKPPVPETRLPYMTQQQLANIYFITQIPLHRSACHAMPRHATPRPRAPSQVRGTEPRARRRGATVRYRSCTHAHATFV
jgi:hypothetical protein